MTRRSRWLLLAAPAVVALLTAPAPPAGGQEEGPAVSMVPVEGEGARYWTRWRGPSGQGVAADGDYPDRWSAADNVLWKVALPGRGNSSPVVWKDRIFLTTSYDNGKRRAIVCLDRDGGKKLWEAFAPEATPEKPQGKNGWASGTPCTDGERVYAYFGNHGLLCVDVAGKQVWHKSFGAMDAFHGTSCSPLLHRGRVIVFQDHRSKSGSFVAAFDAKTGEEVWKTPRAEKIGWGSPAAVRVGSKDQIVVSSQNRVYGYDADTGKELWNCGGNFVEVTPTPVAGHGLLFCCSGRNGPTLAIRPDGKGDVTKTHLAWKKGASSPFIPSPLLYGDYLYMVDDIVSVVLCYEAKTGKLMYRERLGEPVKHGFSASPIGVNGKVFFTSDSGETYVLKAGPAFELLHVNRLGETTLATPALVGGRWYWRTEGHLLCIGKKG
jgi:outer membrane protein assembly factor BamB